MEILEEVKALAAYFDTQLPEWYLGIRFEDDQFMYMFLDMPPNAPAFDALCEAWKEQVEQRKERSHDIPPAQGTR